MSSSQLAVRTSKGLYRYLLRRIAVLPDESHQYYKHRIRQASMCVLCPSPVWLYVGSIYGVAVGICSWVVSRVRPSRFARLAAGYLRIAYLLNMPCRSTTRIPMSRILRE